MRNIKLKTGTKTSLSFRTRLIIGSACCLLSAFGIFVSLNFNNSEEAKAAVSGSYRSVASGKFEDAMSWEMFDGKKWHQAQSAPLNVSAPVIITNNNSITVNHPLISCNIVIEKTATLILNCSQVTINKQGIQAGIIVNGTLDLKNCIVNGDGNFKLADDATIIIGSSQGIDKTAQSGNIQLSGIRYYSSFGNYIYKSQTIQHTGTGLPASVSSFEMDNASGVELQTSLRVTGLLSFKKGVLTTGTNVLELGGSKKNTGTLIHVNGGVNGIFKRWLGKDNLKDVLFPLANGNNYNGIYMTANAGDFSGGTLQFNFISGKVKQKNISVLKDTRVLCIGEDGYQQVVAADGLEGGLYKLALSIAVSKFENKSYWTLKAKPVAEETREAQFVSEATKVELKEISIIPNPFNEKFTLKFYASKAEEISLSLVNANGQIVFKDKMQAQEKVNVYEYADSKGLTAGTYLLYVQAGEKVESRKIVKQ